VELFGERRSVRDVVRMETLVRRAGHSALHSRYGIVLDEFRFS